MKLKTLVYGVLSYALCSLILLVVQQEKPSLDQYDCIIVLGNSPNHNDVPNPILELRLNEGIRYLNTGLADKLILTGAAKDSNLSEAELMKVYCIENGIAESTIILEESAKSTIENLKYSNEIMNSRKLHSGLVVTSCHHINRTQSYCKELGLDNLEVVGTDFNFISVLGTIPITIMEKLKMISPRN